MTEQDVAARAGTRAQRWARAALRLYPRAWRARYGVEVAALLADHRASLWTLLDVLLGALDAHLHRDLLPERIVSMAHRIRTSEIAIFCAYILFFIPWLALLRIPDPLPEWHADVAAHPELAPLFSAMEIAGYIAFLAIAAGALPIGFAALRQAFAARRHAVLLPLGLAALLVVLYVALSAVVFVIISGRPGTGIRPLRPGDAVLSLVWLAASLIGAVAGPYLVARAIARSDLSLGVVRLALFPAVVAVAAIAAGTAAALALTLITAVRSPDLYNPIASPIAVFLMLAATALAVAALWRALTIRPDVAGA